MYYRNDNLDFNSNFNEEIDDIRGKHHNKYCKKSHTTDNNKGKSTHTTDDHKHHCAHITDDHKHHYTHTTDHKKHDHTHTTDHTTDEYDKMPYAVQPMGFCPYMMPNCPMMQSPEMMQPAEMHSDMKCGCDNNSERYDDLADDWNDDWHDDMQRQRTHTTQSHYPRPRPHQYPYHQYPYYQYPYYHHYPYYPHYPYYHQRPRPWWMR